MFDPIPPQPETHDEERFRPHEQHEEQAQGRLEPDGGGTGVHPRRLPDSQPDAHADQLRLGLRPEARPARAGRPVAERRRDEGLLYPARRPQLPGGPPAEAERGAGQGRSVNTVAGAGRD